MAKNTQTEAPQDAELLTQYQPNPMTQTILHRIIVWADGAGQFDDAVNEATARLHEAGNMIVKREFRHVSVGDREVVMICHLTFHVPLEDAVDE